MLNCTVAELRVMKILYLVRWFGNYKVPVFKEMKHLTGGDFYVIYSVDAVSPLTHCKMQEQLGNNAIGMENEKHLIIGNTESNFSNSYIDIPWQSGLFKMIRKINPDIIISDGFFQWTLPAVLMSWRRKLIIFYERTAYVERNCPRWRSLYRKIIGRFASGFIINGSLTREYLTQMGFGHYPMAEGCMVADTKGLQTQVIGMTEHEKADFRQKIMGNQSGLLYLFIGQLVERKGISELLYAWKKHSKDYPEDKLVVIGSGVLQERIESEYHNLSSVTILGQIDYDSIYKYYASSDVFVMPTLEDNWSLVVPEAMACGLPIATTIYNGCYVELVQNGINGFVFDVKQEEDIVRCLGKFHNVDLKAMGESSRKICKDYTPEIAAQKMYKLSKKILENLKSATDFKWLSIHN